MSYTQRNLILDRRKLRPSARQILDLMATRWMSPMLALKLVGTTEFRKRITRSITKNVGASRTMDNYVNIA